MLSAKVDKGKGRGADERTPLLQQQISSGSTTTPDDEAIIPSPPNNIWLYRLMVATLVLLTTCFIAIVVLLFLAGYSYVQPATHSSTDSLVRTGAVVFKGPTRVDVVAMKDDTIIVRIDALLGIDGDRILELDQPRGGIFARPRTALGRWAVQRFINNVTISISPVSVFAPYSRTIHAVPKDPLVTFSVPQFTVPITTRRPTGNSWLTPLSWNVAIKPNQEGNALLHFAEDAFKMNRLLVTVEAASVSAYITTSGLFSLLRIEKHNVDSIIKYEFPPTTPGAPTNTTISNLVSLQSYSLHPIPPSSVGLSAEALIVNPLPQHIRGIFNPAIPFTVSLLDQSEPAEGESHIPSQSPIARVTTSPISLTHPNITLELSGLVLPVPPSSLPLLSQFLSNYLSGRSSPILITTPPPFSASLQTNFPGPSPKPQIIKHVTIQQMKIYPDENGTALLTSGVIIADIAIPESMHKLDVDVRSLLPDVLVFDGPPPNGDEDEGDEPTDGSDIRWDAELSSDDTRDDGAPTSKTSPPPFPAPPLPTPLPPRAFARIRPTNWLNATSADPGPGAPGDITAIVTALIKDVPLEILPGRDKIFSSFVGKVVFKGSAEAGVRGQAAVGVRVTGLALGENDEMELKGLPVEGVFMIRRGDVLHLPRADWLSTAMGLVF